MRCRSAALLVAAALCVGACKGTDHSVLPRDRFVQVYADLMQVTAHTRGTAPDTLAAAHAVDSVLARNSVTREQVHATVRWYGRDVNEWNGVLQEVGSELERRRSSP